MNQGKYVFSQLMELVSHKVFNACVNRYKGDYKSKQFSCWKQFLCMAFGQLTHRESLSDTILCLRANAGKLYHLGIGQAIAKSTLSNANESRDSRIFALGRIKKFPVQLRAFSVCQEIEPAAGSRDTIPRVAPIL